MNMNVATCDGVSLMGSGEELEQQWEGLWRFSGVQVIRLRAELKDPRRTQ